MSAPRSTYPGSAAVWLETRFAALVRALTRIGTPFELALPVARAYLVLWLLDSGWGRGETNYNPGNVHRGAGWTGDTYAGTDAGASVQFRSYASIEAAADDAVYFLRSRQYAPAWRYLLTHPDDPREWFRQVLTPADGSAGYHPLHPGDLDSFDNALTRIPRRLARAA